MTNQDDTSLLEALESSGCGTDATHAPIEARSGIPPRGPEGGRVPPDVESAIQGALGGGRPLGRALREEMSARSSHDLGAVRIHTGGDADELNRRLGARAFTIGSDIFVARGAYDLHTRAGRELLAHELMHVAQQNSGRVGGGGDPMSVRPAGDAWEREADALAEVVAAMPESRSPTAAADRMVRTCSQGVGAKARSPHHSPLAPSQIQRALADRANNGFPAVGVGSCYVAVWYWAAKEAQRIKGETKSSTETLKSICNMKPNPTVALKNLAKKKVVFSRDIKGGDGLPTKGSVLVWDKHVAVVTGPDEIKGISNWQVTGGANTGSAVTAIATDDVQDDQKKCLYMTEATIVNAAMVLKL